MTVKEYDEGTGITAQKVKEISPPFSEEELKTMEKDCKRTINPFGAGEIWAVDTLKKADLPTDAERLNGLPKTALERGSPEWFAAEIITRLAEVRRHIKQDEATYAANASFILGELTEKARIKFEWERFLVNGKSITEGRAIAAAKTNKPYACARKKSVEIAARNWKDNQSIRKKDMLEAIQSELKKPGKKVPKKDTIWSYLTDAGKNGQLTIPNEARKGGRPKKCN